MGVAMMVNVSSNIVVVLALGVLSVRAYGTYYNNPDLIVRQANAEMKQADMIMVELQRMSLQPPYRFAYRQFQPTMNRQSRIEQIFDLCSRILGDLVVYQVRLISHRGGPQGQLVDKTLSKIEDKSYQLKTMLIQLQQDKTTPVTYFPDQAKAGGYGMNPVYRPPMNIAYRG